MTSTPDFDLELHIVGDQMQAAQEYLSATEYATERLRECGVMLATLDFATCPHLAALLAKNVRKHIVTLIGEESFWELAEIQREAERDD